MKKLADILSFTPTAPLGRVVRTIAQVLPALAVAIPIIAAALNEATTKAAAGGGILAVAVVAASAAHNLQNALAKKKADAAANPQPGA
jgi:hypothetical protein